MSAVDHRLTWSLLSLKESVKGINACLSLQAKWWGLASFVRLWSWRPWPWVYKVRLTGCCTVLAHVFLSLRRAFFFFFFKWGRVWGLCWFILSTEVCLDSSYDSSLLSVPFIFSCQSLANGTFSSVAQSCPTFCNPLDCSTPGLPVHHPLPEFTQTHVHWVGNAI